MSLLDLYSIPIYYISFQRIKQLEQDLSSVGFKNVNMFAAINGTSLDATTLRKDNQISARAYNDLMTGRQQHSGIPSLGAIGCSLSHYALWKKCVDDNLDYITIMEDDIAVEGRLKADDIDNIRAVLSKDKGLFISPLQQPVKEPLYEFLGAHFYIASNTACKELIKHMFPIDIQVDFYLGHMKTLGYINLEGYPIYKQRIRITRVQDLCLKCYIMNNNYLNIFVLFLLVYFVASVVYFSWKWSTK